MERNERQKIRNYEKYTTVGTHYLTIKYFLDYMEVSCILFKMIDFDYKAIL